MKQNIILEKSFSFSVEIIHFCRWLINEHKEFVSGKQLLRSGTSIGANIEEAVGGISKREFAAKVQIAYKEARESRYWLRLIIATTETDRCRNASELLGQCEELIRIIVAILKSTKGTGEAT